MKLKAKDAGNHSRNQDIENNHRLGLCIATGSVGLVARKSVKPRGRRDPWGRCKWCRPVLRQQMVRRQSKIAFFISPPGLLARCNAWLAHIVPQQLDDPPHERCNQDGIGEERQRLRQWCERRTCQDATGSHCEQERRRDSEQPCDARQSARHADQRKPRRPKANAAAE